MDFILTMFAVSMGINVVMFLPAFAFKTDKLTDISYSLTFVTVAIAGFLQSERTPAHLLTFLMVSFWAARLGSFLFMRINKMKRDKRFDGMREHFFAFLKFWLLQGLTVFVVMLAPILSWRVNVPVVNVLTWLGVVIFVKGLLLEATADTQKFRFTQNTANKGKWIDVGVWRWSRHPNYLGEILVWVGMYVSVVSSLNSTDRLWALISPLFIILLLLFVSGIPLLEKASDKKWGDNKDYQKYKKDVPVLIPTISSIKR